jgi:methylmalonyl-CoA mutase N-terminal domain/subunit
VAFTLADACAYVQAAMDAGLQVDTFAKRLSFFFNASSDILEEVAKFRAARRLWARIMKDRFGATNPASQMLRFHTQTAGNTLTAQQIDNNIVRVALQALAAVLGGTQSLHTNSRDEALSLPTEDSVRIALRTQQIIAEESGVVNTVDPLGGSWYIEELTDRIEKEAEELIARIDEIGGVVPAIEEGFIQRQIEDSAYRYQMEIERKERIIVGVNKYQIEENTKPPLLRVNPEVEKMQVGRVQEVRKNRNNERVQEILQQLSTAAKGTDNLMPIILSAVKEYATLGEICGVLREVFGEYKERG